MFPQHVVLCSACDAQVAADILRAVHQLERQSGKASTLAISIQVHLSRVQTWRYLKQLERAGQVRRVGQRGGWKRAA